MYHSKSYSNDPKWLNAKFDGKCSECGEKIKAGEKIFYYPATKTVLKGECAERASADFNALAQDEEIYNYRNGYSN